MKPILMAIADQIHDLETVQRELLKRYTTDYEVICELSAELLQDWQRQQGAQTEIVTIVGERWVACSYELRDLLERSGIPFGFHERDPDEGRALLQQVQRPDGPC